MKKEQKDEIKLWWESQTWKRKKEIMKYVTDYDENTS